MNNKNQKLLSEISQKSEFFCDAPELVKAMKKSEKCMSWGVHNFVLYNSKVLTFQVNGFLFCGYVFISVNGKDLLNITLSNHFGNIKAAESDIYIDNLIDVLDRKIEFSGNDDNYKENVNNWFNEVLSQI